MGRYKLLSGLDYFKIIKTVGEVLGYYVEEEFPIQIKSHSEQIDIAWFKDSISSSADLDKYLDSFRVPFAYNSGKIENDEITTTIRGRYLRTESFPALPEIPAHCLSSRTKSSAMNFSRTG